MRNTPISHLNPRDLLSASRAEHFLLISPLLARGSSSLPLIELDHYFLTFWIFFIVLAILVIVVLALGFLLARSIMRARTRKPRGRPRKEEPKPEGKGGVWD